MANWFYREFGDEVGPVPPSVIRDRVADGTIVATTQVRREDGEWTTAEQVPGLLGGRRVVDPQNEGDSTGGLIPYKNPHALIAYYLGLFSLAPCVGLPLGVGGLVLGIIGLKKRDQNPVIKGSVHAWIGIIMGGTMALIWLVITVGVAIAVASNANK
ncbi:MAG: DUF4339 domain-containing protein [Planctomycetota bacterium]|nr:DUF4339 domain-containing protein [Planctomycetaceae bacterium]MDQ3330926.1 DUF4339 domain-containing protein [Planctomycetota bacterium]